MTVALSFDRKAVEITWDNVMVVGDSVHIACVNPDGGDVSTRDTDNDGRATITFPSDYHGQCDITVTGSDSGTDNGSITV